MTLALAVETSSVNHSVVFGTLDEVLIHRVIRRDGTAWRAVGDLVSSSLAAIGYRFADIERIGVDVGPGNLASVRAGVAYANGLAFSLGTRVFSANALELMAIEISETNGGPILCLRSAAGGNAYAGLFQAGAAMRMRHGPLEPVVASMVGNLPEVSVAGAFRQDLERMLPGVVVNDSGIEFPSVLTLYRMLTGATDDTPRSGPAATPLHEMSAVFDALDR